MMEIVDVGMAGTLESSDITILIEKNPNKGIKIELKSTVKNLYGNQIEKVIRETLEEKGINDVVVKANDKGALDCIIKARLLTAVHRATKSADYNWEVK